MANLLYIKASPRTGRSHSMAVADAFVGAYKNLHPDDVVNVLDLFHTELPPFDGILVQAKYSIMRGNELSDEERAGWQIVEKFICEFKAADKYVFAVPMWNFGIPYRLKQYIDIIVQPTYTFSFTPEEGYSGLVTGKSALVTYARGGEYPDGTDYAAFDHQKPYLELILGFMGITDVTSVVVEPTVQDGPDVAKDKRAAAIVHAKEIASTF